MPFVDGVNLVARAIDVAEDEKVWLLYCLQSVFMTEKMSFEQYKKAMREPKKPDKKRTKEEILKSTEAINKKFRGKKNEPI